MSETVKNTGESNREVKTGWEEVESLPKPKHMREGVLSKPENENYQPKHMRKEASLEAGVVEHTPERTPWERTEEVDTEERIVVKGTNRDEKSFETTREHELSRYREMVEEAKSSSKLQEATRLRINLEEVLGRSEALDKEFEKINEEVGFRRKQEEFALADLDVRIDKESRELEGLERRAAKYKGLFGRLRGLFGAGRAERKELKYQVGRVRHSLAVAKRTREEGTKKL